METSSANRHQSDLSEALDAVEGWLQPAEAWALFEAARSACPDADQALAVEIGSYKGRSAIALASGLRARGGGQVVAIDPFEMEPGQQEVFKANLERAGVASLVEALPAYSHDARPKVEDGSVAVLFVDGSHEYADVLQDVRDWESSLTDGAVVAFNDPFWSGVSRALRDTVGRSGSAFRRPRWVVNTLFFDYRPSARWTATDALMRIRLRAFLKVARTWYRFHSRIEHDRRVPLWFKRLQMWLVGVVIKRFIPMSDAGWKDANV